MRHGRELLLVSLTGLPLVPLAQLFDGYPALVCWVVAWTLLGVIPASRVLELALLTADARSRRPAGMPPWQWRAQRLVVAACAGAASVPWLIAVPSLTLLDVRFQYRAIPLVVALSAALGITIHLLASMARRR